MLWETDNDFSFTMLPAADPIGVGSLEKLTTSALVMRTQGKLKSARYEYGIRTGE